MNALLARATHAVANNKSASLKKRSNGVRGDYRRRPALQEAASVVRRKWSRSPHGRQRDECQNAK